MTGADAIIKCLEAEGVDMVFEIGRASCRERV